MMGGGGNGFRLIRVGDIKRNSFSVPLEPAIPY